MKGAHEISALHECKHHGNLGHHRGSHSGDQELVWERTITLVRLCAGEQALISFRQQHDGRQTQYKQHQHKERREGSHVHKVLEAAWHLALGGLVKVDGYLCQEEAQDEVVNVQA